jgi:hypothetical protein
MQRDWSSLGERQRKRYLGAGRKDGMTPEQVQTYYQSGGNLARFRGQGKVARTGISERQWGRLRRAARESELGMTGGTDRTPTEILESLLGKGLTVGDVLALLERQKEVRAEYRSPAKRALRKSKSKRKQEQGKNPGLNRYRNRPQHLDIEGFYYH